jgi:hypothetical protein
MLRLLLYKVFTYYPRVMQLPTVIIFQLLQTTTATPIAKKFPFMVT